MEELLKKDFLNVINSVRRGDAPEWTAEATVRVEDISDHLFDVDDPKDDAATVKRAVGEGAASYVNGRPDAPYNLRFICYDEYMHQFVFDDGDGHTDKSMLKSHTRMADFVVYDTSASHVWIVVNELSKGAEGNKRGKGRVQLANTIDLLCRSAAIKEFVEPFANKWCVLSASDQRVMTHNGWADGFMGAYTILPEPLKFQFGAMKRLGFTGYETSKVVLK